MRGRRRPEAPLVADCAAALRVFVANAPARRFYEALGGRLCGRQTTDIAGQKLPEVAYGWPDLRRLCRRAPIA